VQQCLHPLPDICNDQCHFCNSANGVCQVTKVPCDDNNFCTYDECVVGYGCNHTYTPCPAFTDPDLLCTTPKCDAILGCIPNVDTCDDSNPCTTDTCVGVNNCTNIIPFDICDDSNNCTTDRCLSGSTNITCQYDNITCIAANACEVVVGCDPQSGCVKLPLNCTAPADWCLVPVCDTYGGCTSTARTCIVDDPNCYVGVCDSENQQCTKQERPNFSTIYHSAGVTCYFAYNQATTAAAITGGVIAGIVVGGVVFAGIFSFSARKAYIRMQMRKGNMGATQSNPLYEQGNKGGVNPLFAGR